MNAAGIGRAGEEAIQLVEDDARQFPGWAAFTQHSIPVTLSYLLIGLDIIEILDTALCKLDRHYVNMMQFDASTISARRVVLAT